MPHSRRILVVDDDDAFRRLLSTALNRAGFVVTTMDGGAAAQAYLTHTDVDLVISDVDMVDIDGLLLLEWWRQRGGTTPFVFVSAMADDIRDRAEGLGALAVLDKPFDFEILDEIIRDLGDPS